VPDEFDPFHVPVKKPWPGSEKRTDIRSPAAMHAPVTLRELERRRKRK